MADALPPDMRGFITEANFDECEEAFPGIVDFYRRLVVKPRTFLELVEAFCHHGESSSDALRASGCAEPLAA